MEIIISKCKFCGKKTYVNESWMIPDGYDDVDWDFNEYCKNPKCPSNIINLKTKHGDKKERNLSN